MPVTDTAQQSQEQYALSSRFGFGPVPGQALPDLTSLYDQLIGPDPSLPSPLKTSSKALVLLSDFYRLSGLSARHAEATSAAIRNYGALEAQTYLSGLVLAERSFRERVVAFWANHFALLTFSYPMACVSGAFVREAIRPHIAGTFAEMTQAVVAHPGMIFSLDGQTSVAASSPRGVGAARAGRDLGINENLGRELMELYTVTTASGFQQSDVDALANLLAGYKVLVSPTGGSVVYDTYCCAPGEQVLLGVSYPTTEAGCQEAVRALATSSFTYANIAQKLVCEFVSDEPSAADVAAVQEALQSTGGNLLAAMRAVLALPDALVPLTKLRNPLDFVVATLRATGTTAQTMPAINSLLTRLGMPLWQPPFPNGWSAMSSDWAGAAAMSIRIDFASAYAVNLADPPPALALAAEVLGPLASEGTLAAIASAGTPAEQLATLICSPEFQRR